MPFESSLPTHIGLQSLSAYGVRAKLLGCALELFKAPALPNLTFAILVLAGALIGTPAAAFDSTHWVKVRGGFWRPTQAELVQLGCS